MTPGRATLPAGLAPHGGRTGITPVLLLALTVGLVVVLRARRSDRSAAW